MPHTKSELRSSARYTRRGLSRYARMLAKTRAMRVLPRYLRRGASVLFYQATAFEFPCQALMQQAVRYRCRVYMLPSKPKAQSAWPDAVQYSPRQRGRLSIKHMVYVFVPGLCFDLHRQRLGQGGGYYDRALQHAPYALSLGLGFRCQYSPRALPREVHDVAMDRLCLF